MKLLFDENLSPRLCSLLGDIFPGSVSVLAQLAGATDEQVLAWASRANFLLTTKDSDFVDKVGFQEAGAKIVWVRLGNCTTESVHLILRNSFERISIFAESEDRVLILP